MSQVIQFVQDWFAEVEGKGTPGRLRQVAFRRGARLRAEVRPLADGGSEARRPTCAWRTGPPPSTFRSRASPSSKGGQRAA